MAAGLSPATSTPPSLRPKLRRPGPIGPAIALQKELPWTLSSLSSSA